MMCTEVLWIHVQTIDGSALLHPGQHLLTLPPNSALLLAVGGLVLSRLPFTHVPDAAIASWSAPRPKIHEPGQSSLLLSQL